MKIQLLVAGSIVYLIAAVAIAGQLGDGIFKLKPNEFGDLLAGVFAPLAFTWFVVAVWMQRYELSLQRRELAMQRDEMKGTREALEQTSLHALEQAKALRDQAIISADEAKNIASSEAINQLCCAANQLISGRGGGGHNGIFMYRNGIFQKDQFKNYLEVSDYGLFLRHVLNEIDIIDRASMQQDMKIEDVSIGAVDLFIDKVEELIAADEISSKDKIKFLELIINIANKILSFRNRKLFRIEQDYVLAERYLKT